jgi:hypothetical protein
MYQYAKRLSLLDFNDQETINKNLAEQAQSYLAAMNSMSFVNPDVAWFVHSNDLSEESVLKKRKLDVGLYLMGQEKHAVKKMTQVVTIKNMRQEYELVLAKLDLAHQFREFSMTMALPDPQDCFSLYIQAEKYEAALKLGKLFSLDLKKLFVQLASKYMMLLKRYAYIFK